MNIRGSRCRYLCFDGYEYPEAMCVLGIPEEDCKEDRHGEPCCPLTKKQREARARKWQCTEVEEVRE